MLIICILRFDFNLCGNHCGGSRPHFVATCTCAHTHTHTRCWADEARVGEQHLRFGETQSNGVYVNAKVSMRLDAGQQRSIMCYHHFSLQMVARRGVLQSGKRYRSESPSGYAMDEGAERTLITARQNWKLMSFPLCNGLHDVRKIYCRNTGNSCN